jgi:ABC-2 type transport system ATP-binding protein
MSENTVIHVNNVEKEFYLPSHSSDSLKASFIHIFARKDKSINVHHALKGISLDIKKGEFFGVLGRNGSGKSTLLKILAQIYQPTKGSVSHNGKLVPFIELGVGFKKELTGRENVYLNGALLGFSNKEIDERYDSIVEFAELEKFMYQKLKNYSSGMKVRLAFSVAIQANADILLLDEVLAVGDAAFKKKCVDYFKRLKDTNKTVILVSHSMKIIRDYCDRCVLIEDGKIAFEGSAEDTAEKYLELFGNTKEAKKGNKFFKEPKNKTKNQVDEI